MKEIAGLPGIVTEACSPLCQADEADKTSAREQLQAFLDFSQMVKEAGVSIPILHCANSAGIMDLKESHGTAARAGIILYGLYPSDQVQREALFSGTGHGTEKLYYLYKGDRTGGGGELRRDLCGGPSHASGHCQHRLWRRLSQELSNKGEVLVHGTRARILGRICMDQLMIDVTRIPEAEREMR